MDLEKAPRKTQLIVELNRLYIILILIRNPASLSPKSLLVFREQEYPFADAHKWLPPRPLPINLRGY